MTRTILPLMLLLAAGCTNKEVDPGTDSGIGTDSGNGSDSGDLIDNDGDGSAAGEDCDDNNADVFPGAEEVCDGVDNNCDGAVDEGVTTTWYGDADADGYGDDAAAVEACAQPDGTAAVGGDCDDGDPAFHPGAAEDDCADPNDYNCDGSVGYADADGDGFAACEECDDDDPAIHPDAAEVCDGVDNDCDALVDDDDDSLDTSTQSTFYMDDDGDGYGDPDDAVQACEAPSGATTDSSDCDDADAAVNPAASEVCDGVDNDCDALVDDDDDSLDTSTQATWYADGDGDGYGDPDSATASCTQASGTVSDSSDCDDADAAVNPAATEVCDGVDNDCDGVTDPPSAADADTWYADSDGDGFGDASNPSVACDTPSGYTDDDNDCDDTDGAVNPDAVEVCDSVDNDCDGVTDPDDAWWDTAWAYRIPVTVTAAATDVDGPPVAVDVDFRAALDSLGDSGSFNEDSVRVVLQDCAAGQPELPSQFEDEVWGLFDKADHRDPASDEAGAVLFLYDTDGDYTSLETLAASGTAALAIYFDTTGSAPGYTTGLSATVTELSNDDSTATFDTSAGGLLGGFTYDGSVNLTSQVTSCCGNGAYTSSWSNTPMYTTGTTALAVDGPVVAAIESEASLTGYDVRYTYWMFDGRPELWAKVWAETTASTTFGHATDSANGLRPWESQQTDISSGAAFTIDTNLLYGDTAGSSHGLAFGYAQPPTYVTSLSVYDPYLIAIADDWAGFGGGTPQTVASGTTFLDNIVMVNVPHTGAFSDVQDTLFGLMEGISVSQGAAEAP
ncbi:MAG: putative metal-binding motif-containing protein [Alphaproteobacteria bacterium]|nr:putative metal-binding motif-containing protein [Alphaproteobacteria bacterium]